MTTSNFLPLLLVFIIATLTGQSVSAQHCAPIVESYLSGIAITREPGSINFKLEYSKTGGQPLDCYQAYILAYRDKDVDQIHAMTPQEAIKQKLVTVVDTQLINRNDSGSYPLEWKLEQEVFVIKMLDDGRVDKSRIYDAGGWKGYEDKIRIGIFIPFLEDEKYSVAQGLPEDRHECNYAGDAGLLFEQLPHLFSVHFGVVQAFQLEEGVHHIQINGFRPGRK